MNTPISSASPFSPLPPGAGVKNDSLREACRDFEALFLHTLLREGRGNSSVSLSGEKSHALAMVQDVQDEAIGREMSRAGGVGLGQMLYRELSKTPQDSSPGADNLSERRVSP